MPRQCARGTIGQPQPWNAQRRISRHIATLTLGRGRIWSRAMNQPNLLRESHLVQQPVYLVRAGRRLLAACRHRHKHQRHCNERNKPSGVVRLKSDLTFRHIYSQNRTRCTATSWNTAGVANLSLLWYPSIEQIGCFPPFHAPGSSVGPTISPGSSMSPGRLQQPDVPISGVTYRLIALNPKLPARADSLVNVARPSIFRVSRRRRDAFLHWISWLYQHQRARRYSRRNLREIQMLQNFGDEDISTIE